MSEDETVSSDATAAANAWNTTIIDEFHANEGRVGGPLKGAPVALVHTRGARSNALRINPMMYLNEGGKIYVFASKTGAPTNPDWFHNLVANPTVTVEIGTENFEAKAQPLTGVERDRIYAIQASRYPGFGEYAEKTSRVIPVVELIRV
jgi:deazaflavin-dependent oxidoreductase (nitroreductase family)